MLDARGLREAIRTGEHTGPTAGLAPGYTQANLVALPEADAFDFLRFCVQNPKPCPVLDVTDAGSPEPAQMAPGADLRTDVPRYGDPVEIRDGELPVFWACGVTPQAVAVASRPELMITHAPGHMFVTDVRDETMATH